MERWFDTARFGVFVHWGIASVHGWELSWPLVGGIAGLGNFQNVGVEEYFAAAREMNPVNFNPKEWARLARRAGMQYAVVTSKHHDGFAMYHTRASDWSIERTAFKRDTLRETLDAFRAEGLRAGIYYSLIDWHHPDYPRFTESDKPYRWGEWRRSTPEQWERFIKFMFAQIRELLTNYGKIDVLWFDGGWERTPEEWKAKELVAMVRALQPEIIINDRLPGFGDYQTPEQAVPPRAPERTWETCMTMNESWGWNPADARCKSAGALVRTLAEVAGKGGNLLLNISPRGDGSLPPEQIERLEAIAAWMERGAAESIVGTRAGLEPWQFYGPSTRRGDRVYAHLMMRPYESVAVRGVHVKRVKSVSVLTAGGKEVKFRRRIGATEYLSPDPVGEIEVFVPEGMIDPFATVLAIDFGEAE
ncbi:MAG: alpha-L-fucosidase [Candidatus Binataceae bacterium]